MNINDMNDMNDEDVGVNAPQGFVPPAAAMLSLSPQAADEAQAAPVPAPKRAEAAPPDEREPVAEAAEPEAEPQPELEAEPDDELGEELEQENAEEAAEEAEEETSASEYAPEVDSQGIPYEYVNLQSPEEASPRPAAEQALVIPKPLPAHLEVTPKQLYWDKILKGDPDMIDDEVKSKAQIDRSTEDEEAQEEQMLSVINRSWVVDHKDKSKQDVRQNWAAIRKELSEEYAVADSEKELYLALSDKHKDEKLAKIAQEIYTKSFQSGLEARAQSSPPDVSEGLDAQEQRAARDLHSQAFEEGTAMRARLEPLARNVAKGLPAFVNVERNLFSALELEEVMEPLLAAKDELFDLNEQERSCVYHLALQMRQEMDAQEPADGEEPSLLTRSWRAFRRGSFNLGVGLGQGASYLTAATLSSLGDGLDPLLGTNLNEASERIDKKAQVLEELRRLAQEESYPILPPQHDDWGAQLTVDVASALPHASLAFGGPVGFGTLMFSGVGSAIAEARERAPENDLELQVGAGLIGGALQAGIYMGMSRIGARVLEQAITHFSRARGCGLAAYSLAALKSGAAMTLENAKLLMAGKFGVTANMALQELAAQCEEKASHIDWKAYGDNFMDVELNMREAAANLPFILIASGRLALRHFQSPQAIVGNGDALRAWGVPKNKIQDILNQKDMTKKGEELQLALQNSPRWAGANFVAGHMRYFRLLNYKSYRDFFEDPQAVCDFLKLPSMNRQLPQRYPKLAEIETDADRAKLARKYALPELTQPMGKSLQVWDYWWQKSRLSDHIERSLRNKSIGERISLAEDTLSLNRRRYYPQSIEDEGSSVPKRMERRDILDPYAEKERRALLLDRTDDVKDLSYQYLLNIFPMNAANADKDLMYEGELTRKRIVSYVATTVMEMFFGKDKKTALAELNKRMIDGYLELKESKDAPAWMNAVTTKDIRNMNLFKDYKASDVKASGFPMEFFQAIRLNQGLQANSAILFDLIPLLDDFQSCLARKDTPAKAFHRILKRELEFEPSNYVHYPFSRIKQSGNDTDFNALLNNFGKRYQNYEAVTGRRLQRAAGVDGEPLFRAFYPDGKTTHWHKDVKGVLNEFMFLKSFMFRPFGGVTDISAIQTQQEKPFTYPDDLNARPTLKIEHTPFDQLCSIALDDMFSQGIGINTSLMTGLKPLRYSQRMVESRYNELLYPTHSLQKGEEKGVYTVEEATLMNPYNLMLARAQVYWLRLLESKIITQQEALDFLCSTDSIGDKSLEDLKKTYTPASRKIDPLDDGETLRQKALAAERLFQFNQLKLTSSFLAQLSTDYQYAHMDDCHLPESLKLWLRYIPLYPHYVRPVDEMFTTMQERDMNVLHTLNRNVCARVKAKAPRYDWLRNNKQTVKALPLYNQLMESIDINNSVTYNMAWAHRLGAEAMSHDSYSDIWLLMSEPKLAWERMDEYAKSDLELNIRSQAPEQEINLDEGFALLDEVLKDYPHLGQYSQHPFYADHFLKIVPERKELKERDIYARPPAYKHRWKIPKQDKPGFHIDDKSLIPLEMRDDPRVIPAMRLLDKLRYSMTQRAHLTEEGIKWKGEYYGFGAKHLPNITKDWSVRPVLEPLLRVFKEIGEKAAEQGQESIDVWGVTLRGLPEQMNFDSIKFASIYRSPSNLNETMRLMPGDRGASILNARTPYVVRSRNNVYYTRGKVIREDARLDDSLLSMENLPSHRLQFHSERTVNKLASVSAKNLLDSLLLFKLPPLFEENFGHGISDLNELLMRLAEDSGLCYELENRSLDEMMPMQLYFLSIINNMVAAQFGTHPEEPFKALTKQLKALKHNENRRKHLELELQDMQVRMHESAEKYYDDLAKAGKVVPRPRSGRKPEGKRKMQKNNASFYSDNFEYD